MARRIIPALLLLALLLGAEPGRPPAGVQAQSPNLLQNPGLFNGAFPGGAFPGAAAQNNATSRSVSISENGKTIKITENGETGITVTVTEIVDGEEVKETVNAANPQELRRKSAEAYRLYERHVINRERELQLMIQKMLNERG